MSWSVVIPRVGAVHFNGIRVTGTSRCYPNRNVLHYERNQLAGKTTLNQLGEPNHFSCSGIPVGFSRKIRPSKLVHYNRRGKPIGATRCIGIILVHYGRITKEGWTS